MINLKDLLILKNLLRSQHTINEVIEKIRKYDFKKNTYRKNVHFYTHLNKRFDPLKKSGMIVHVGYKKGPSGRDEKLWELTDMANAKLLNVAESMEPSLASQIS